jgi:signal recognition particle receptor subunit beta
LVVDSQAERREANVESLERWLDELTRAGVITERLPVLFQLNKRDLTNAMSVEDLTVDLRTPVCDYVASIVTATAAARGVNEALARLTAMVDALDDAR